MSRRSSTILLFACLAGATVPAAAADYVETFDKGPAAVMLNAAVTLGFDEPWLARIENGTLALTNTTAGDALRYYHVDRVQLPGTVDTVPTDGAAIEVTVTVDGSGRMGAGVITCFDQQTRDYLLFGVGPVGDYYVMVRTDGRAHLAIAGSNAAIVGGGPNTVRARVDGDEMVFEVNATEVVRYPTAETPGETVGIAAFGIGTFTFDDVRITPQGQ